MVETQKCAGCNEEMDLLDMVEVDGSLYCADCVTQCNECGEYFCNDDIVRSDCDGNYRCEECHNELFTCCDSCGCEVPADDARFSGDGRRGPFCDDCYSERYISCYACGDEVAVDDSRTDDCGDSYCEDCYYDTYTSCDDCGCEVGRDSAECDDDGNCYCSRCYRNNRSDNWSPVRVNRGVRFERIKSTRAFGIELETSDCDGYTDIRESTCFGAKDDGSIDGKEFISPVLSGDEGLEHVERFCRLARSWHVDKSCGYHLHMDMTSECIEGIKSIIYAYSMTADVWRSFVASSRRGNHYCGRVGYDWSGVAACDNLTQFESFASSQDRYCWFNIASYRRHKTFEVRLHSGTLDYRKVSNWIKAHARFADWAASHTVAEIRAKFAGSDEDRFNALTEIWGDDDLAGYYRERACEFGTVYGDPVVVA